MFNVISLLTKKFEKIKNKKQKKPNPLGCSIGSNKKQVVLDSDKPKNIVPCRADSKPNFSLYHTPTYASTREHDLTWAGPVL